ncbi:4Fe-4S dicluster domain-containing protein [Clostridium bovifaecis]|uniref:4Fe-4S dicluster domain-containing protein n=1 Tax=Clostridium bovifaecis TaxID=2184719 RepID=A0A6I6EPP0_9CLOT|nr:4Fe-4S dicluster domain-containing protein [Clostridium bovifaecis]
MGKILIISPEKCTDCRTCVMACSFNKTKSFNPQNAAVSVYNYEEVALSVPIMCMQCEDPSCMKVCTVNAISKNEDGTVIVDNKKCIGCKLCISACQFGNMSFNSKNKAMVKCDLCNGDPMCAKLCPSGAIQFKEPTPSELNKKKIIADKFRELFEEVDK